jgi:trans-aconitate methyltransferase
MRSDKQTVGSFRDFRTLVCTVQESHAAGASQENFPFLQRPWGPREMDLSAGMLREARNLCRRQHWLNVFLIEGDAADYASVVPFDGVLFSFSYNTMPHHRVVLRQVWKHFAPVAVLSSSKSSNLPRSCLRATSSARIS